MTAHGGLHVMVANAGIGNTPQPVAQMSLEDWRVVTSVNLDGVFLCLRHSAPAIIASGGGSIVNIASASAFRGLALAAPYAAAKAGVLSLTKTAAVELRDQGLQVHAICPGFIETDLVKDRKAGFEEGLGLETGAFDQMIANSQGRYATPAEVARTAVWLASGRASFSTGTAFVVDGGLHSGLL